MKLNEKIFYLRKKEGYSQEALAEKLGVSRQAVSKWENGDADPEISKLKLMADVFGVTTDWLLSDKGIETKSRASSHPQPSTASSMPSWVENLPSIMGKMIKRYGWIVGVYVAFSGAAIAGLGFLARFMTKSMFGLFGSPGDDLFGQDPVFIEFATRNPVSVMGSVFILIGSVLFISGILIAVALKRYAQRENQEKQ